MNSIKELISKIKTRPELYTARKSILLFQAYLYGWMNRDEDSILDSDLLGEFQTWVEQKYNINSAHSWADIILFYSLEEHKALDRFFELWDEFLEVQEASAALAL